MDYKVIKLNYCNDYKEIGDSMCFDSTFKFLTAQLMREKDGSIFDVTIEVQGYVSVVFKGDCISCFSEMPDELKKMFEDGSAYDSDLVVINENNWWEVFVEENGVLLDSDVMEQNPCDFKDEEDIINFLKDVCDTYVN